ncbi:hypothetical protein GCM10027275_07310 [Rhabdobacter roseus]|uniref:DUF3267 domain-containing protein n=1 Tax=Rhabdobacter roseus TaxID=1655419 RepID=A0A840TRM0_9BACT|nr:DUF3267 domain-containing protein [Rhabdobacter roseus]MBB5282628.1 hypothetical protein [Rhabdobacter roseus]
MKPTIQALHESGQYQLVESFTIDEMSEFLAREAGLKKSTPATSSVANVKSPKFWLLFLASLLVGAFIGWLIGMVMDSAKADAVLSPFWQIPLSVVVFFFPVLPLHEAIHALFFKLLGAPKVGFGYSAKGLMVYAYAQRFVMTLRENALVAAMPFVLITASLVGLLFLVPSLQTLWVFLLLVHTFGCLGDFILIKHACRNRAVAMYTYDDLDEKRTYFFAAR